MQKKSISRAARLAVMVGLTLVLASSVLFYSYFRNSLVQFAKDELAAKQVDSQTVSRRHEEYLALKKFEQQCLERSKLIDARAAQQQPWSPAIFQVYRAVAEAPFAETVSIDRLLLSDGDLSFTLFYPAGMGETPARLAALITRADESLSASLEREAGVRPPDGFASALVQVWVNRAKGSR